MDHSTIADNDNSIKPQPLNGSNRKTDNNNTNNNNNDSNEISYWELLYTNREYRLLLLSFMISHGGDWLTYIATIEVIENQLLDSMTTSSSRSAISILVFMRVFPSVIASFLGGTIADLYDKRKSMIVLDIIGSICGILYIIASYIKSIGLIYLITFIQMSIAGLYQPICYSIVPFMVTNDKALQKATTLQGLTWAAIASIGTALGGTFVAYFGNRDCFLIDSSTYLCSALLLWMMRGKYNVTETNNTKNGTTTTSSNSSSNKGFLSVLDQFQTRVIEGIYYLKQSFFGPLIFLKSTSSLVYGSADVLNVVFSEVPIPPPTTTTTTTTTTNMNGTSSSSSSSQKLGVLFSVMGIGCIIGPLIAERYINIKYPITVQRSCIIHFGFLAIGFFGWGLWNPNKNSFWYLIIFASIRSIGTSTIFIHSNLLFQKFSSSEQLGRIMSIDIALANLDEGLSAVLCGILIDYIHLTPYQVCFVMCNLAIFFMIVWTIYDITGHGAIVYEKQKQKQEEEKRQHNGIIVIKDNDDDDDDDDDGEKRLLKRYQTESTLESSTSSSPITESSPLLLP